MAACLAEFLTGSTPIPAVIRDPAGFAIGGALYGGGALTIREVAIRWRKRWGAVLLLGGAYAVGEEGFAAKTMVNPIESPIGNQLYSHWAGVNWVPLAALTLFHAAFSIAVPLVLVELLFPETKGRRLLGNLGMAVTMSVYALALFVLAVYVGPPFTEPPTWIIVFLAAYASLFIVAAYVVPRSFLQAKGERPDRRELNFILMGLGFMGGFFLIDLFGPHFLPWPATAALYIPLASLTAWYMMKHAGRFENDLVKIAFVLGMTLVFVPMDIVLELSGDVGILLFTALVLAIIIGLRQRRKRPTHSQTAPAQVLPAP